MNWKSYSVDIFSYDIEEDLRDRMNTKLGTVRNWKNILKKINKENRNRCEIFRELTYFKLSFELTVINKVRGGKKIMQKQVM